MHKSRLSGFIIDCKTEDLKQATRFWSKALGLDYQKKPPHPNKYVALDGEPRDLHIEVQNVKHSSRVHLDIETDNIEAEVRRLKKLGAKEVRRARAWVVMKAPTGQRFCVVRVMSKKFKKTANSWR